jgi:hypothetical protein
LKKHPNIQSFIKEYGSHGGIVVNWVFFGPNNETFYKIKQSVIESILKGSEEKKYIEPEIIPKETPQPKAPQPKAPQPQQPQQPQQQPQQPQQPKAPQPQQPQQQKKESKRQKKQESKKKESKKKESKKKESKKKESKKKQENKKQENKKQENKKQENKKQENKKHENKKHENKKQENKKQENTVKDDSLLKFKIKPNFNENSLITGNNQYNIAITVALVKEYEKNKYPDQSSKKKIAAQNGLTTKQVKYWFHNRRQKLDDTIQRETFRFDKKITKVLQKEYDKNKYPDDSAQARIASKSGLTKIQVKRWFEKRRQKFKKIQLNSSITK